jgi:hypothetical protein
MGEFIDPRKGPGLPDLLSDCDMPIDVWIPEKIAFAMKHQYNENIQVEPKEQNAETAGNPTGVRRVEAGLAGVGPGPHRSRNIRRPLWS